MSEIIKKKLNLTQFSGLDIDKAHRVGNFQANTDRAIIARFATHRAAELVLANRRALKDSKIVIAEDLTAETLQLFHKVKEMDRVQQVWTKRGVIFIKDRDNNILKVLPHDTIQTLQKRLTQQQKTRGSNQSQLVNINQEKEAQQKVDRPTAHSTVNPPARPRRSIRPVRRRTKQIDWRQHRSKKNFKTWLTKKTKPGMIDQKEIQHLFQRKDP
ncbi:hypothetical protein ElyMa_003475900 [Elysia marginata]|uniref:Uncharacterized protein n=1 Tax=Elysia marginata TaxID=1093978 RepID=A0AAV4EC16_9GAST|nr:hypothetical protein ElyMa_003475900 [Elysia marginata]